MEMMWWWMLAGMLAVGPFWVLVVVAIVAAVVWLAGPRDAGRGTPPADRALDILREHYARAGIDRDEFEARRRDLVA